MWIVPLALVLAPVAEFQDNVFAAEVAPFVARHCLECHGAEDPEAELSLASFADVDAVRADAQTWTLVRDRLEDGDMPPRSKPRPADADALAVIAWLDSTLQLDSGTIDPGRVTLRRLNRVEYQNTIRDLVGVEYETEQFFPADDVGHGFDNIGDVLSMPDLLLEKYLDAAEFIAGRAVAVPYEGAPPVVRFEAGELDAPHYGMRGNARSMHTSGEVAAHQRVDMAGEYVLRVRAHGQQAGAEVVRMGLRVDGKTKKRFDVRGTSDEREEFEVRFQLTPGKHTFAAAFLNDFYDPDNADPSQRDRNMYVQYFELVGPLEVQPTAFQSALLSECDTVREAVGTLASRAFRRTATRDEVRRLLALSGKRDSEELRLQLALMGMLVSPHFLFRVELHPAPDDADGVHEISDSELASRLSYFLWSTMPDQQLLDLAEAQELSHPDTLQSEITRMLGDTRAAALARHFAGQWLQFRNLTDVMPDPERFPAFGALRTSMRLETELFFDAVLREGRPVHELLAADFTFLNGPLARHYGIEGVDGADMRRVQIPESLRTQRGGLLAHGSILTVTSNPTRTSPVLRGKWILETLLDAPPPPPPPGIGTLEEVAGADELSIRDRFERHRSDANCAVCHAAMDPLGFGLENYDAIGAWREQDERFPVDASGVLPDGRRFAGPADLRELLLQDQAFERSLFRSLTTYALGRGLTRLDRPAINSALAGLPDVPTIADMIRAIIDLDAFRSRRGESAKR